jgi:hypothetical protein
MLLQSSPTASLCDEARAQLPLRIAQPPRVPGEATVSEDLPGALTVAGGEAQCV